MLIASFFVVDNFCFIYYEFTFLVYHINMKIHTKIYRFVPQMGDELIFGAPLLMRGLLLGIGGKVGREHGLPTGVEKCFFWRAALDKHGFRVGDKTGKEQI